MREELQDQSQLIAGGSTTHAAYQYAGGVGKGREENGQEGKSGRVCNSENKPLSCVQN